MWDLLQVMANSWVVLRSVGFKDCIFEEETSEDSADAMIDGG